jgi:hypothetical protein
MVAKRKRSPYTLRSPLVLGALGLLILGTGVFTLQANVVGNAQVAAAAANQAANSTSVRENQRVLAAKEAADKEREKKRIAEECIRAVDLAVLTIAQGKKYNPYTKSEFIPRKTALFKDSCVSVVPNVVDAKGAHEFSCKGSRVKIFIELSGKMTKWTGPNPSLPAGKCDVLACRNRLGLENAGCVRAKGTNGISDRDASDLLSVKDVSSTLSLDGENYFLQQLKKDNVEIQTYGGRYPNGTGASMADLLGLSDPEFDLAKIPSGTRERIAEVLKKLDLGWVGPTLNGPITQIVPVPTALQNSVALAPNDPRQTTPISRFDLDVPREQRADRDIAAFIAVQTPGIVDVGAGYGLCDYTVGWWSRWYSDQAYKSCKQNVQGAKAWCMVNFPIFCGP